MASPSIENEDRSNNEKKIERMVKWIPNNLNPDLVFVVCILIIIIDSIVTTIFLQKLEGVEGDLSVSLIIDWAKANFNELLFLTPTIATLFILFIFAYVAEQRILKENTVLKIPLEEFFNLVNEPRVAKFYMNLFLLVTGIIMLRELTDRKFPVIDTMQFMMVWFVLLLLLPIPEAAKSDIDPFNDRE